VRDALVITLSIYVVFSIAMAPWNNLKTEETLSTTCETGCAPVINYPEDGYYHYKDSIVFEWDPVSVQYRFTVLNGTGHVFHNETFVLNGTGDVFHNETLTDVTTSTTNRLPAGNYTSFVYYKGMVGSLFDYEIIEGDEAPYLLNNTSNKNFTEEHDLASSSKITLIWEPVEITYGIEIREHKTTEIQIVHQAEGLAQTSYEFKEFDNGKTYSWSVYAVDSMGFVSESSNARELNIDTTKFLAYELFNNWEVPFILLGVLMVVALQAGVFLAKEETND
jgi:hypothetical protein